jgi:hypothetical protein
LISNFYDHALTAFLWKERILFEGLDQEEKAMEAISTAIRLFPFKSNYYYRAKFKETNESYLLKYLRVIQRQFNWIIQI